MKSLCIVREESYDQARQHTEKQRHYLLTKVHLVKAMVFPVVTYGCESWTIKKAERRIIDGFELWCWRRLFESPLDCKETHPKGDQSWVFIGRTDAEAKTPIIGPPDAKSWLTGKDPDTGKDWGQKEKGMTEDEMVGWHHLLNEHGFGWTPGVGDGQGGLMCCSSWGCKESDMTEQLNWTDSFNTISIKIPMAFFTELEKSIQY